MHQNYPNPFNPTTKIKFDIKAEGRSEKAKIELSVFNILGKQVAKLVNAGLAPGTFEVEFDARNLPSGVYYYRLTDGDFEETRKMVLLK